MPEEPVGIEQEVHVVEAVVLVSRDVNQGVAVSSRRPLGLSLRGAGGGELRFEVLLHHVARPCQLVPKLIVDVRDLEVFLILFVAVGGMAHLGRHPSTSETAVMIPAIVRVHVVTPRFLGEVLVLSTAGFKRRLHLRSGIHR
jgi:hypothetical protein